MAKTYSDDEVTVDAPKSYHDDDVTVHTTPPPVATLSATPSIGQAVMRGVNKYLPFGQQIEAAGRSLPVIGTGKSYGQNYGDIQRETADAEAAHPVTSVLAGTAGGLAGMVLPGVGVTGATRTTMPVVSAAAQGGLSAGSQALADDKPVLPAVARGTALGGLLGAAPHALPAVGRAIGATKTALKQAVKSDDRLLQNVGTGSPKSMRDKLMGVGKRNPGVAQKEAVDLLRGEFNAVRKDPKKLKNAVQDSVYKDAEAVNDIFSEAEKKVGKIDPAHAAEVLRKRQGELMSSLDTQDEAKAMEPMIRKIERNIPKDKPAPTSSAPPVPPKVPSNDFDALDKHDVSYTPEQRQKFLDETGLPASIGNTSGQTEVGTVASPGRPAASVAEPVASEPPKGFGGRELRREISKAQETAASVAVGKRPSAQNRAASEYANSLRDVLADHVEKGGDAETAQIMRDINAQTAAKMRILKIADYKASNAPFASTNRLAEIGKGIVKHTLLPMVGMGAAVGAGHGNMPILAAAGAGAGYAAAKAPRAASEALASLARMVQREGATAQQIRNGADEAVRAGARQAVVNALIQRLAGRAARTVESDLDSE